LCHPGTLWAVVLNSVVTSDEACGPPGEPALGTPEGLTYTSGQIDASTWHPELEADFKIWRETRG
jgi:hypothetical protein